MSEKSNSKQKVCKTLCVMCVDKKGIKCLSSVCDIYICENCWLQCFLTANTYPKCPNTDCNKYFSVVETNELLTVAGREKLKDNTKYRLIETLNTNSTLYDVISKLTFFKRINKEAFNLQIQINNLKVVSNTGLDGTSSINGGIYNDVKNIIKNQKIDDKYRFLDYYNQNKQEILYIEQFLNLITDYKFNIKIGNNLKDIRFCIDLIQLFFQNNVTHLYTNEDMKILIDESLRQIKKQKTKKQIRCIGNCKGIRQTKKSRCELCNRFVCDDCENYIEENIDSEIKDNNIDKELKDNGSSSKLDYFKLHELICNKDQQASIKLIKDTCQKCPGCFNSIERKDGCDRMWCVVCHTFYSDKTGEILKDYGHNPEIDSYIQRMKKIHGPEWTLNINKTNNNQDNICLDQVNRDNIIELSHNIKNYFNRNPLNKEIKSFYKTLIRYLDEWTDTNLKCEFYRIMYEDYESIETIEQVNNKNMIDFCLSKIDCLNEKTSASVDNIYNRYNNGFFKADVKKVANNIISSMYYVLYYLFASITTNINFNLTDCEELHESAIKTLTQSVEYFNKEINLLSKRYKRVLLNIIFLPSIELHNFDFFFITYKNNKTSKLNIHLPNYCELIKNPTFIKKFIFNFTHQTIKKYTFNYNGDELYVSMEMYVYKEEVYFKIYLGICNNSTISPPINYSFKLMSKNEKKNLVLTANNRIFSADCKTNGWQPAFDVFQLYNPENGYIDNNNNIEIELYIEKFSI